MSRAPKVKRPKSLAVDPIKARVIRGPNPEGRWYWQAVVYRDATERTVWSGWATREQASQELAALVAGGELDGSRRPDPTVETVGDVLETWLGSQGARADLAALTMKHYTSRSKTLHAGIGAVRPDRLDVVTLERFRDTRLHAGAAPATVAKELKILRFAWRWGRELGYCPPRDLPKVAIKPHPVRTRHTPTRADVLGVLDHLDGWPYLAVRLLFATGARVGEIAVLRWEAVDLARATITLRGKTGPRAFPLSPDLAALLRPLAGDPAALVLGVTPNMVRGHLGTRHLAAACERAGVPRFSPHGLRRATVDALLLAGVDVGTAASLMGHTPAVMLAAYRQATDDDRRQAITTAALGAVPGGGKVIAFARAR